MMIRCIRNAPGEIPPEQRSPDALRSFGTLAKHYLTHGKHYVVYARVLAEDGPWYFVADDVYSSYPMMYPGVLFEVADDRPSRYWERGSVGGREGEAFREWLDDPSFYGKLVDGDPEAMRSFADYKEKMDLERPVPGLSAGAAVDLGGGWRMCPACDESWDGAAQTDGMTRCPRCGRVLVNPGYAGG